MAPNNRLSRRASDGSSFSYSFFSFSLRQEVICLQEGNRKLGEDLKASRETAEEQMKLIKVLSYVMLSDKIQFLFQLIVQEGIVA